MNLNDKTFLGIMSGTSLDGLDLALCQFNEDTTHTHFKLLASQTIAYSNGWKEQLNSVYNKSALDYFKLHSLYGSFIAEQVTTFLNKNKLKANYIASHGHTIFHQPELGFSTQIGCGATIAAKTGIDTICDFRGLAVALNGQGAPLVPIGDRDLFSTNEACLNIGGIANISFTKNNSTKAFDICLANILLNYLSNSLGFDYDESGKLAAKGNSNESLLKELVSINTQQKSIGRELFENTFSPILNAHTISTEDKLATCVHYMVIKINDTLNANNLKSLLITGGGAYNTYFINQLKKVYNGQITIPEKEIIEFKEAIIFAYLGYLRIKEKPNSLASVTHSKYDNSGACVYLGKKD